MFKRFLAALLICATILSYGCSSIDGGSGVQGEASYHGKGVTITNKGNYFDVVLDYTTGLTPKEMGEDYARGILTVVPDFEAIVDSYIAETVTNYDYNFVFHRTNDIKPQIQEQYYEEIVGLASVFTGGNESKRKDNKVSEDELLMYNLFTDVVRPSQCSYISVYADRSETGKTLTARNLDWFGGSENQLPQIQAVITIKYPDKQICSIGYMGYVGIITGFNDSKVFAGILDSGTGAPYSTEVRRSYVMDLRYGLENTESMEDLANYMADPYKLYTYNHVIGLSDPNSSIILENNFSGQGANGMRVKRAIRYEDSQLNREVEWGIDNAIASVNSFVLYGNHDNHTVNDYNTRRWKNIRNELTTKGPVITKEELREICSFNDGSPGVFSESGDVYNRMTLQMVLFEPDTLSLEVYFRPKGERVNPDHPVFEKIPVFQ